MMRRGANAIEFALLMPVFLSVIFASIEFGWYFSSQGVIDAALMEACEEGAMIDPMPDDCAPKVMAHDTIIAFLSGTPNIECIEGTNCTITLTNIGADPTSSLQCEVDLDYVSLTGWFTMPALVDSVTVTRYENQVPGLGDPSGCY